MQIQLTKSKRYIYKYHMLNILILNYEYPPLGGGAANATKYILNELTGYDDVSVDLVTSSTEGFKKQSVTDNITIHFLDIGKKENLHFQSNRDLLTYAVKSYLYCRQLKKTKPFDLIHAFFGIPCGFLAMHLNLPYIVSLRGSDVPFYNERFAYADKLVFHHLSKKIWANSHKTVANSLELKNLALKTSPGQSIHVIPNGIDTKGFRPKSDRQDGSIKILAVGRLIPRKGFRYLIQALEGLQNISLTIVGDGPEKESLRSLASHGSVKFAGYVPHELMSDYYQSHHLFALPSLNEGMSNTVLEAMACGLPILMTDTGGTAELVQHNKNGFLLQKKSPDDIAEKIALYQKQPELLKLHGQRSRKMAKTMSWSSVADRYVDLYHEVLSS